MTFEKEFTNPNLYLAFIIMVSYSILDAIDGIHARKTGTATPLGQIFDHGTDAFAMGGWVCVTYYSFHITPDRFSFYGLATMFISTFYI